MSGILENVEVTSVAAGRYNSFAVAKDGQMYAWGWNNSGQLDDNSNTDCLSPVLVLFPGAIEFVKQNPFGSSLVGARFGLFGNLSEANIVANDPTSDASRNIINSLPAERLVVSGSDGRVRFNNLVPDKEYQVVELEAAKGFVRNVEVYSVNVGVSGTTFLSVNSDQIGVFVNYAKFGSIGFIQQNQASESLVGGRFGLFANLSQAQTVAQDPTSAHSQNIVANLPAGHDIISGIGGEFSFSELPFKEYWVVELASPIGYVRCREVNLANVVDGNELLLSGWGSAEAGIFVSTRATGNMRLVKEGVPATGMSDNTKLAGVAFGFYDSYAAAESRTEPNYARKMVTDSVGEAYLYNIPTGVYYVSELVTLTGFVGSKLIYEVIVSEDNTVLVADGLIVNERAIGAIEFKKVDADTGLGIASANFGLFSNQEIAEQAANAPDGFIGKDPKNVAGLAAITKSEVNCLVSFVEVSVGDYWVVELEYPAGFVRNISAHKVVLSEENLQASLTV